LPTRRCAIVVGAGIGGLAAGIALRRAGWHIRIYERASEPRELGFGLLLAPNALAALEELGVARAVVERGAANGWFEIRRVNGAIIRRLNAPLGGPSIVALRSTLHGALLEAVGHDALQLGREVVDFQQSADAVTIRCGDGSMDAGAVLVGADGVASIIRKALHPQEPPPRPSGYTALRGVGYGVSRALADLSGIVYLDRGIEAAAIRAATDAVYWYLSLLSRDVTDATAAEVVDAWRGALDHPLREIVSSTASCDMRLDPLFRRDPLDVWGAGRVTLLGDAAHPMLPHTGQGAAQALEDAVALGLALQDEDVEQGLRRYEQVRMRRTRAFVKLGPRIARITTTTNAAISAVRTAALRLSPARMLALSTRALRQDPHAALRAGSTGSEF
jgi:2-polyprenyl-6-methoxyphenol hydroxylase-like FAD-dependent oxidoreductase